MPLPNCHPFECPRPGNSGSTCTFIQLSIRYHLPRQPSRATAGPTGWIARPRRKAVGPGHATIPDRARSVGRHRPWPATPRGSAAGGGGFLDGPTADRHAAARDAPPGWIRRGGNGRSRAVGARGRRPDTREPPTGRFQAQCESPAGRAQVRRARRARADATGASGASDDRLPATIGNERQPAWHLHLARPGVRSAAGDVPGRRHQVPDALRRDRGRGTVEPSAGGVGPGGRQAASLGRSAIAFLPSSGER